METNNSQQRDGILTNLSNTKIPYRKIIIILLVAIMVITGIMVYLNYFTITGQAKSCVNGYLRAIKKGKSPYEYKDNSVDDFINVLDYKFLSVNYKKEEKSLMTYDEKWYERFEKDRYDSLEEYFEYVKEVRLYGKNLEDVIINETDTSITFWTGKYYNEYSLLYDVKLTDRRGQVLYKKVYFILNDDNSKEKFKIQDIVY